MAINLNIIPVGDDDQPQGGNAEQGRRRRGGINMHRIELPDDQPPEQRAHRGINPFGFLDPARRRAEAAAQEAILAEQRRLDEINRQQGMAAARQQIREQSGGLERAIRLPDIGMGARPALARLAQTNPERALKIANKVVDRARAQNDSMMADQKAGEAAQQRVEENRKNLNSRPVSTTQIDLTQIRVLHEGETDNGFVRITKRGVRGVLAGISAATTVGIKGVVATASGKRASILDTVRADGSGIHVDAPFKDIPHVDIGTELGEYDISANPPPWLDRFVGLASALPGVSRNSILGLVPFGTLTVRRKKSGDVLAEAPTLFPAARERELKAAARRISVPPTSNIQFIPEPTLADLLGDAADALDRESGRGMGVNLDPDRPYIGPGYTPLP